MAGGIKRLKGVQEAVDAINYINSLKKDYKIRLSLCGSYDNEEYYKNIVKQIGDGDGLIEYKGGLSKEEILRVYGENDLSIALSYFDTFNMSVAESLLCGTPAIISNNCGIAEIIENEENGIVVDMELDYKREIETFIDHIYNNPALYKHMREKCLDMNKKLNNHVAVSNYLEVFEAND
jgi:glycosyltransferase involved in cell wall biosynthesis